MPKTTVTSSALSLQNVNQALESISQLTPPEKLLLYLKLPTGQPVTNPLKSPVNPLGSRFEITQTINWVRTHFVEDKNVSLPKQNIYNEYLEYCSLNSMKPLSTADFGKVMKQIFPEVRPRRLGTRGNSRYCYSGLGKRRSLSCPQLPEDLGEEENIKEGQSDAEPSAKLQIKEEETEKQLSGANEPSDFDVCKSDSFLRGSSIESTKLTGVSEGDCFVTKEETHTSPALPKNNSAAKKRKQLGPTPVKREAETKKRKQLKKSSTVEEITNVCTKNEQRTSICDIEHFPSTEDKSLTCSYIKADLEISSDLNGSKSSESFSKVNRSYSVELPSHSACRTTSRTVSVDVISDYNLISSNLETVCNLFGDNTSANSSLNLQDSGISSTQEAPPALLTHNLRKKSDNANTPTPDLNSFVVSSLSVENKLPLPRLRPMKIPAPSQVAKIIIVPSNVIKQSSAWPQRQYKPIQPRPEKDTAGQNFVILDKKVDANHREHKKSAVKEEPNKNISLHYDSLPKLESLGKDALDTYLNGEGNSQELDEELLQYFKPDFSSTEISELSEQVLSLNHNDGLLVSEKALSSNDAMGKATTANGMSLKVSAGCKSSVPFYQSVSSNEVHQLNNRCITEFQMVSGSDLLLPSPSGSFVLKRQASFDSGVRDLETPLNIPPSPNTRCKLFNFTPISPRPSSPRENSKSSCDTSIQSPFISPRNTPNFARTPLSVAEIQQSGNAPPKQYPARLRSASTSCKSNSLISNPSPITKKTQDLPSFNDLVKMSKRKLRSNHILQLKKEQSDHKSLLPPISPLSTPDSPIFSFSEVRKDSPLVVDGKAVPPKPGNSNGYQNSNHDLSLLEIGSYLPKETCFNFDFYKNRSKSVPAREMMSKNSSSFSVHQEQVTDTDNSVLLLVNDAETSTDKLFLANVKSPDVAGGSGCNNLDKMLAYYKEDSELSKTNKLYLDVLNEESPLNSGDSTTLCNDNDPIGSSCASDSCNEQFLSRRHDVSSLQSFLQPDQMPTPLDCLLGDVDMGLNGLSSDGMDVFSSSLPPIPTD